MITNTNKVKQIYTYVLFLLIIIAAVVGCNIGVLISLLFYIFILYILKFDIARHSFFFFFLFAFFVFLMGEQVTKELFNYSLSNYTVEEYNHLNLTITISLLFLLLGYILAGKVKFKIKRHHNQSKEYLHSKTIKTVSLYTFYLFCIPWFIVLAEQVLVVQNNSYLDLYSYNSRLPTIITELADMTLYAFCFFAATFPTKQELRIPTRIVLSYAIISLLIGRRIYFVTYTMLVLGYFFFRQYYDNKNQNSNEKWVTKKLIVIILIMLPVAIVFLYSYRYIRYGKSVESSSLFDSFIGFFAQQGDSASLIPLGIRYKNQLGNDYYSLYSTLRTIRMHPITRYLLGIDYSALYTGSREHLAIYSGSYARMISYLSMRSRYLYGFGTGSCYIAELFHDFGYLGVCIGNFVYGYTIKKMLVPKEGRFFKNAIGLVMFQRFLMVPRYNYDSVFAFLITPGFWVYFLFAYIVSNFLYKKASRKQLKSVI